MSVAVPTITNDIASKIWNGFKAKREPDLGSYQIDYVGDTEAGFFGCDRTYSRKTIVKSLR